MAMHGFQVRHLQQRSCCDPKGVEVFPHTPITRRMFCRGIGRRYGSFPIFTVTAQKRTGTAIFMECIVRDKVQVIQKDSDE